jgi:hypothetical protein
MQSSCNQQGQARNSDLAGQIPADVAGEPALVASRRFDPAVVR